jgi:DNA invertase Pin-like site-specific DNA recombinase
MLIGYARVSTVDQNLDLQNDALKKVGCRKIFTDKVSGSAQARDGLDRAVDSLRAGDTLVVWKLDRLGRSLTHLVAFLNDLKDRKIGFRSLQENIHTTSGAGKLVFHIFASLAAFERDLIRERTLAGIASARARGRLGGRPRALDAKRIAQAKAMHKDKKIPIKEICTTLGVGRTTLYRYLNGAAARPRPRRQADVEHIIDSRAGGRAASRARAAPHRRRAAAARRRRDGRAPR